MSPVNELCFESSVIYRPHLKSVFLPRPEVSKISSLLRIKCTFETIYGSLCIIPIGHILNHVSYMTTHDNNKAQKKNKLLSCNLFILTLLAIVNKLFSIVICMQIEVGFRITHTQKDYACLCDYT